MYWLRQSLSALCFLLISTFALGGETVKAPRGWDEHYVGQVREVGNGNATVRIMPWQSLGGASVEQWLDTLQHDDPQGGVLLSTEGVMKDKVPGSYSVSRKAQFNGSVGYAVLYGCPGQPGYARLMTLDVKNGSFFTLVKGALFGEKVCKREPKGASQAADSVVEEIRESESVATTATKQPDVPASISAATAPPAISDAQLKKSNQELPERNRPVSASVVLKKSWSGFPAMRVSKAVMVLEFPDKTALACSDWSPAGEFPSRELQNSKGCKFPESENRNKVSGFKSGERIALAFGRIGGFGNDGLEGSTSVLRGGDVVMSKDGTIAIGSWNASNMSSSAASAKAFSVKKGGLTGRYYLDGHTISIATDDGEIIHGLIGISNRNSEKKITALFLNGKHYWDRKK